MVTRAGKINAAFHAARRRHLGVEEDLPGVLAVAIIEDHTLLALHMDDRAPQAFGRTSDWILGPVSQTLELAWPLDELRFEKVDQATAALWAAVLELDAAVTGSTPPS